MKTLHTAYRVSDLAASLGFYSALGYAELGRVDIGEGATLTMLKFPDEEIATLELVHRPTEPPVQVGTGFSHLVVQVDNLAATVELLSCAGLRPGSVQRPGDPHGPQTSWLTDPDGYKIELVQWPQGHPDGITAADFASKWNPRRICPRFVCAVRTALQTGRRAHLFWTSLTASSRRKKLRSQIHSGGEYWTIRLMSVLRGGCWCGAVRYQVPDEFLYAWSCHCSRCRAATGSAFKPLAGIERDKLEITEGADALFVVGDDALNDTRCASCGSFLFSVVRDGAYVHVGLGSLIDAPRIRPTAHIFVGSKAPWFEITDELPQFEEYTGG